MGASDRRKLWICRFAWTTQTRCPHTHSRDRKKRRKRLEDSFEQEENRNGRRLYTLISTVPGPSDGVHLTSRRFLLLELLGADRRKRLRLDERAPIRPMGRMRSQCRSVAQSGSAPRSGRGGR